MSRATFGIPFVTAAVDLVSEYFWPHARAALRQIGLSQSHSPVRRALRRIRHEVTERISRDDIRSDALARSLDADDTQTLLEGLERAGWLRGVRSAAEEAYSLVQGNAMGRQPEITEVRMTKTDPKNDPNISRTLLIACWGNVRLIAVIAVIPVLVRNQSIITGEH